MHCWENGKDLLIDVAIIHSTREKQISSLLEGGAGAAATYHEKMKVS